jgi:hypothetical protein
MSNQVLNPDEREALQKVDPASKKAEKGAVVGSEEHTANGNGAENETATLTYEAAITDVTAGTDAENEAVLPLRKSRSNRSFVPSTDSDRPVRIFPPLGTDRVLELRRTSTHESEGASVFTNDVKRVFGAEVLKVDNGTEVAVVLSNGRQLNGYFVKRGLYLPKALLPQGIEAPKLGYALPVVVANLIVG